MKNWNSTKAQFSFENANPKPPYVFRRAVGLIFSLLMLLFAHGLWGQTATWTFGTLPGGSLAGSSTISGVTANNAAYGPNNTNTGFLQGCPASATNAGISSRGFNVVSADVDRYLEFSVTVAACKTLTLTQMAFDALRGSSGPPNIEVRSSVNNDFSSPTTWAISPSGTVGTSCSSYTVSLGALPIVNGGQTIRFRVYGYNAPNNGANAWLVLDNVTLSGSSADATPPVCSISGPDPVCEGTSNVYSAPAGMNSYAWSITVGNGTVASINGSSTGQTVTVDALAGGNYTLSLTITDVNGCVVNCSEMLTVTPGPACSISGPLVVCTNDQDIPYSGPPGMFSYSWSIGGNGAIDGAANTESILVDAGIPGSYTLSLTVSDGVCSATCSEIVTVTPLPDVTLRTTANTSSATCGDIVTIGIDATDFTDLFSLQYSVNWDATQLEYVSHTALQIGGVGGDPVIGTGDVANGNLSYSWFAPVTETTLGPNTVILTLTMQVVGSTGAATVSASNTPLVSEAVDVNFCVDEANFNNLASIALSPITCMVTGADEVCPNSTGNIFSGPAGGTYAWTILSGSGSIPGATDQQNVSVTAGNICNGSFTLQLTYTDANGCVAVCQKVVTIDDNVNPGLTCPGALTAVCSISEQPAYGNYAAFTGAGGSASDNCGINQGSFTHVGDVSDNNTCPEVVTRTYQIADLCGNTATCTQLITIDDNVNPGLTCPGALTAVCSISEQPAYGNYAAFTGSGGSASDNCGINQGSFTHVGDVSDNNTCPEVVTRTYQIADLCGNTATCTQLITIDDNVNPGLTCPGALTAVCSISEQPAYGNYAAFTGAGGSASDNCGINQGSFTHVGDVSDNNTCPEVVTRTYQIADLCGNTATCTQLITIDDNVNPGLTCPGALTAVCSISEQPAYGNYAAFTGAGGSASDNCGINQGSFTHVGDVSDNNTCPEVVTRTYQIADLCGNTATCTQLITIDDNVNPGLTCPGALTAVCSISEQPAYGNYAAFTGAGGSASDNCGINQGSFTHVGDVSDNNTCPEVVTRTYQIADLCGNTATCTQLITIDDNVNPGLTCPGALTAVCSISEQPAYGNYAAFTGSGGSASDNCGINQGSFTHVGDVSDNNTCPEVVTRTYQIADLCGNTATCTQLITIDDNVNPGLTCPGALTAVCSISEQPAYGNYAAFTGAGGSASDNCGINQGSFTHVGDVSDNNTCPEVVTRTYQIADLCGNTATCTQLITIDDNVNPGLTCPGALTAVCSISEQPAYGNYAAFTGAGGSASDNCGINQGSFTHVGDVSDNNTCPEVVTRTYQIADLCGNTATCTQLITIDDNVNPGLTCPGALTAVCSISEQPAYGNYAAFTGAGGSASDNCGINQGSFTHVGDVSDNNTCPEVVTRTYQIADLCGNTATCTQLITIDDNVNPGLTCPGALTAVCSISEQPAYGNYAAFTGAGGSASDNCGINQGSFTHVGDVSDNNTCPEVVTRTYQIADLCGNTATCTQLITIDDNVNPGLTCPGALTAVCSISEQPAYGNYAAFTGAGGSASDNCGINQGSFTHVGDVSDNNTCPEVVTRTYQIADLCGNTATCTQLITIDDNVNPGLTCPGALTAVCSISEQPAYGNYAAFTGAGGSASDNCGINQGSFTHVGDVSDNNTCPEVVTRTYQIADLCGNTATCTQLITIDDNVNPGLTCPGALTAVCSISEQPAYSNYAAFTGAGGSASDNCGINQGSFTHVGDVSDNNTCPEVVTRTYQIADLCGNTATCTQLITIDDNVNPGLTCPGALTAVCSISEQPAYGNYAAFTGAGGSASDNCGINQGSFTHVGDVSDNNTCPEVVTRTYQIADLCGNTATCTQLITIDDNVNPGLTCPGALTAVCSISEQPAYGNYAAFTGAGGSASDNCGINQGSFTHVGDVSDNNTCPEVVTRTYQIADLCGNTATCTQLITIDDNVNPGLTCPGALTAVCSISEQPAYGNYAAFTGAGGSASDNCGINQGSFTHVGDVSDNNTCPEVVTRTYQIADLCGNTATCTQLITIDDNVNPGLTCPGALTAVCSISEQPAYGNYAAFTGAGGSASDNCGINQGSFTHVGDVSDNNTCPEVVTRTYQIADLCGNTATCTQLITIDDLTPPTITLLGPATIYICYGDTYTDLGATADDNCQGDVTANIVVGNPVITSIPGTYTVTYNVSDACGNPAIEVTRTVVVEEEPDASASPSMICSDANAVIDVSTTVVSTPTQFNWSASYGAVTGGAGSGTSVSFGSGAINDGPLSNVTNTDLLVTYTITPYTFGPDQTDDNGTGDDCTGASVQVQVTVKPEPAGANQTLEVCSGTVLSIDLQNIVDTYGNGLQSSFSWVAANNPDVNGENSIPQSGSVINSTLTLVNPGNGPQTVVYTVTPTGLNGCPGSPFTITIEVIPCEIDIIDPCTCLDNATTLTNGQFSETIQVSGPAGDTWTVVLAPGLYQMASPAPPAAPLPVTAGTSLVEGPAGIYTLSGKHVDAQGYSISVTNGSVTLSASNTCYYPNPSLSGLNAVYCSQDGPQAVSASALLGDNSGPATAEVITFQLIRLSDNAQVGYQSGAITTFNFDPAALAQGFYKLILIFDADDDGAGHPGCVQRIEESFEVRKVGCGNFPWNGN
jgi:peroxiredoxin